jgi:hypothetical protein
MFFHLAFIDLNASWGSIFVLRMIKIFFLDVIDLTQFIGQLLIWESEFIVNNLVFVSLMALLMMSMFAKNVAMCKFLSTEL